MWRELGVEICDLMDYFGFYFPKYIIKFENSRIIKSHYSSSCCQYSVNWLQRKKLSNDLGACSWNVIKLAWISMLYHMFMWFPLISYWDVFFLLLLYALYEELLHPLFFLVPLFFVFGWGSILGHIKAMNFPLSFILLYVIGDNLFLEYLTWSLI